LASLSGNPWDHELYQIRQFAAVVETGSITKAAIRAALSQPALSFSIAKLEEEVGVRCSTAHTELVRFSEAAGSDHPRRVVKLVNFDAFGPLARGYARACVRSTAPSRSGTDQDALSRAYPVQC
jgi:hypothetical protein